MSTSLAEQLRRLRVPQTFALVDSKQRASILFDPKDAATKNRQTIFDLGYSGLTDLISLNPAFFQFEQTLFNQSTITFQRSVESTEVNILLDKNIKKFLQHLSPFFMLEPAHKCLEWLIRRFQIHQYNKNEFLALIMPYHETMVFVKCVQTLNVKNANDPWKWLQPIQKPGVPLSKTAILNRAASDPAFVKFVCKATTNALKELDNKAHLLQAQINFYCITIVGALEHCKEVTESFIANILPSLLKGFTSPVIDFTAAVFMITAQLVSKTILSPKLLRALVAKICSVNHTKLQGDMLLLLILLYQKQMTVFNDFPEDVLIQFISNSWLTTTLAALAAQSVAISALCDPLVGSCLRRVQAKGDEWNACRIFLESLLKDVHFIGEEAKSFIRTTLDNYHRNEPLKPIKCNEVIEIDSDEDIMLDKDAQIWYSGYLQRLEMQYPKEFDYTIKETLQGKENVSESRRKALRTVLAFRLQSTYSEDNAYIYENLYHRNATNRIEGVKFLVKNLENLNISEQSKNLLSDSLTDRLNDDNPEVVYEVLKMPTKVLKKMLGIKSFLDALVNILNKSHDYPDIWMKAVFSTIKHITSIELLRKGDNNYIFLALLPYLMPRTNEEMILVHEILTSKFAQVSPFLKCIIPAIEHEADFRSVTTKVIKAMTNVNSLPSAEKVLQSIENVKDTFFYKPINFSCFLLVIKSCYISGSDPKIGLDIFKFIENYKDKFQFVYIPPKEGEWIFTIRNNKVPLDLYRSLLETLAINSELSDLDDFTDEFSKSLEICLKIYNILLTNSFTSRGGVKNDYSQSLQNVLDTLFPLPELKLKFFANFYVTNRIPSNWISSALRIRSFKICNLLLDGGGVKENFIVDRTAFIKILIGLTSTLTVTRQCSLKTVELLAECPGLDRNFAILAKKILQRSEEILMDERQFPLILFTIISPKRTKVNESEMEQESATKCLAEFLVLVTNENVDDYLKAEVLDIIKQINSSQILKKLLKNGLDIVEHVEKSSKKSSNGDGVCLNKVKSKILKLILNRYEGDTLLLLIDEPKAWILLEKCLKLHRASVDSNGKLESLACEVMDIFTEFNYEKLPSKLKEQLIRLVVNALTFAGNYSLTTAGNKLITKINLDCRYAVPILEEMKKICSQPIGKRRVSKAIAPDVESLQSAQWNNGITLLELLQNKKKLTNYRVLIPILFELLKKCLDFEEQSTLEYAKQLILSCLLHCCQKVSSESAQNHVQKIPDSIYRTDLVVQCIRATQNPQTHHHALLLLSHLALMLPQQVLHNMMDVFTFMGSSVVRHDDSFSFQIISNIIESVVPTLVKANSGNKPEKQEELVIPVLKVFVDIALDVPEHRRLPLYLKLLRTLGASQYLWMFHCLLFESHIVHDEKEKGNRLVKRFPVNVEECPKRIDIALQLTKNFGPNIALQTCISLFDYLPKLPMDKIEDDEKKMEVDLTDTTLFNIDEHSAKQLRHYKYVILQFVSTLTSSAEFINAIALRNEEEMKELKPYYQNLIIKILSYIPVVTKAMDENADTNQAKFWKILLHHSYDVLDNAISLLSPDMLLVVVHGLLQHQLAAVRKKVIEILISKLQYKTDFFIDCQEDNLLQLLNPFNEILDSILGKDKLMENASSNEIMFIQQIALIAIKLLSKIMALNHVEEFKVVLTKLTKILKKRSSISKIILATAVLAVTEVSSNLKAHSIAYLSKFMPHLVAVMQEQAESLLTQSPENVCLAIVTGVQKLYETLPLFLGPYNVDILTAFTLIWVRVLPYQEQEPRAAALISKLRFIWSKFASIIPLRVLIPNCCKCYKKLMLEKQYSGIRYLMNLLTECMENVTAKDIMEQQNELTTLFLQALEFRSDLADYEDQAEIVSSEEHILDAFVVHILKLSESNFRPLYHKVYDWAIRDSNSKDRVITYFLLSSRVAEALKSLFVLFASDFIQNAADLLDKCNGIKSEELYFSSCEEKNAVLIESILKTLYYVFLHDSKGFIDPHRFDILMQPLVDQLENPIVLQCEKRKELLVSCLSQLAVAVSNDSQWKQLNYQVLLKTRSNNPEHRILAFSCCVETVRKLGESFSPLLPETIPFVAELFEDENEDVEKSCRKGVHEMEKILGESLQSYF